MSAVFPASFGASLTEVYYPSLLYVLAAFALSIRFLRAAMSDTFIATLPIYWTVVIVSLALYQLGNVVGIVYTLSFLAYANPTIPWISGLAVLITLPILGWLFNFILALYMIFQLFQRSTALATLFPFHSYICGSSSHTVNVSAPALAAPASARINASSIESGAQGLWAYLYEPSGWKNVSLFTLTIVLMLFADCNCMVFLPWNSTDYTHFSYGYPFRWVVDACRFIALLHSTLLLIVATVIFGLFYEDPLKNETYAPISILFGVCSGTFLGNLCLYLTRHGHHSHQQENHLNDTGVVLSEVGGPLQSNLLATKPHAQVITTSRSQMASNPSILTISSPRPTESAIKWF